MGSFALCAAGGSVRRLNICLHACFKLTSTTMAAGSAGLSPAGGHDHLFVLLLKTLSMIISFLLSLLSLQVECDVARRGQALNKFS